MVTLHHIAERAGVSIETVSRVLNGRYRQSQKRGRERVEAVQAIALELGYRAHAGARGMRTKRFMHAGILFMVDPVSQLVHASAAESIIGINSAFAGSGYVTSLIPICHGENVDGSESRAIRDRMIDGVVLLDQVYDTILDTVASMKVPTVYANVDKLGKVNCVGRDEVSSGKLCVAAMAALGYRKIVFVERIRQNHFSFVERREGARREAKRLGLGFSSHLVELSDKVPISGVLATTLSASEKQALVASDSYVARRLAIDLATDLGLCAGRDYAISCCDDVGELKEVFPQLARVSFDRFRMGSIAGQMLLRKLATKDKAQSSIQLECEFQPGSTAPPAEHLATSARVG